MSKQTFLSFSAFQQRQWLHEKVTMLRHTYIVH